MPDPPLGARTAADIRSGPAVTLALLDRLDAAAAALAPRCSGGVTFLGCGSSHLGGGLAAHLLRSVAGLRAEAVVGSEGEILFADADGGKVEAFTVVEMQPPTLFSFRWTHPAGEEAVEGNSLLVTFELVPHGEGTLLRFRETGFRERGWEAAVLEEAYQDHVQGWDHFLPRLASYATTLDARP